MLLRSRVVVSASVTLLALGISVTAIGEFAKWHADSRYAAAAIESEQALWRKVVGARISAMQANMTAITRNRSALSALKNGSGEGIKEEVRPTFNRLLASGVLDRLRLSDESGRIVFADPPTTDESNQAFLRTAMEKTKVVTGILLEGGDIVAAIAFPIYARGKLVGSAMFAQNVAVAAQELKEAGNSEVFVVSSNRQLLSATMKAVPDDLDLSPFGGDQGAFDSVSADNRIFSLTVTPLTDPGKNPIGSLISLRDRTTYYRDQRLLEFLKYATLIGLLVLSLVGLSYYMRHLLRPLADVVDGLTALSQNNLNIEIHGADREDELAEIAKAMIVFKENATERQRLEQQGRDIQAANERRVKERDKLIEGFDESISGVVTALSSAAQQMESTASSMSATANQTQEQSVSVSAAAHRASLNVQAVAATAEELAGSIAEISRQVNVSTSIVGTALQETDKTRNTIQDLAGEAKSIGKVVTLIHDIAWHTNLLALNATVEAARAGDAGKGFAVVAQEINRLAVQAGKATDEISAQIGAVQSETDNAVGAIERIRKVILEVDEAATAISAAVQDQGSATREIAQNVNRAAEGTREVDNNIENVREAAQETDGAAIHVLNAASTLAHQSQDLRDVVETFLGRIREV